MRISSVMRALAVGLLGCAAGAAGRQIPVHREYTQPIRFADEAGWTRTPAAAGEGLDAQQVLRITQAQEALLGKETLFDLTLGKSGAALFGPERGVPVSLPAPAEPSRRREDPADGNWLSRSLTLPGLGQSASNAATGTLDAGGRESDWGWLADAVSGRGPGGNNPVGDRLRDQEESLTESDAAMEDRTGSVSIREKNPDGQANARTSAEPLTAAAFPDSANRVPEAPAAAWGGGPGPDREWAGGRGTGPGAMSVARPGAAAADMNQTRKVLDEMSAGFRPDFTAMRNSLIGSGVAPAWGVQSAPAAEGRFAGSPMGGAGGGIPARVLPDSVPANRAGSTWQGGWTVQNAGIGLGGRYGGDPSPLAPAVTPAERRENSRPGITSGGTKPGWF